MKDYIIKEIMILIQNQIDHIENLLKMDILTEKGYLETKMELEDYKNAKKELDNVLCKK